MATMMPIPPGLGCQPSGGCGDRPPGGAPTPGVGDPDSPWHGSGGDAQDVLGALEFNGHELDTWLLNETRKTSRNPGKAGQGP